MSYDMNIGDREFNYTYNVAAMWYAAKPNVGIRCFYGMTGREAVKEQRDIQTYMEENRETLLEYEPENGWGTFAGALKFVNSLIIASLENPDAVWEGD